MLLYSLLGFTQWFVDSKRDYNWVLGKGNEPSHPYYKGFVLGFNNQTISCSTFLHPLFLVRNTSSISNSNGELIIFTDGRDICNRNGQIMLNGDSLPTSQAIWELFPDFYPLTHKAIILPNPGKENLYYVIHEDLQIGNGIMYYTYPLRFSIVDMEWENGLGAVTERNVVLINDTLDEGLMAAVRHGNGRDWWILVPEFGQPAYYRILLDPGGLHVIGKQYIGSASSMNEGVKAVFSPDGNLFARSGDSVGGQPVRLELFKFDRCTGLLSDYLDIGGFIPWQRGAMVEFSPNSKLLYYTTLIEVWQYDLTAPDIAASKIMVATWDSTFYNLTPTAFVEMQNVWDGRILISSFNNPFLHVIENPDIKGIGCNVIQRAITMCRPGFISPVFPNFRLGPKIGSECDTIYHAGIEDMLNLNQISAYPNPASEIIQFELDISNNNLPMRMCIYDYLGKQVDDLYVAPYQGVIRYDVRSLPAGVYMGVLSNENTQIAKVKFIVE